MVEMLAKTKPSKHRLPKSLRERGQPREYDVTRENNQLNVNQFLLHFPFQRMLILPADLCEGVFTPPSRPDALGCPIGR